MIVYKRKRCNNPDGNDLESSSEDDLSSTDEDENQPILSNSDSDHTEASLSSSESEPEDGDELSDSIATNNSYKTRDDAVKWKRSVPTQQGQPSSINLVDANTIGPTQQVLQSFESPVDTLNLTLPDACIDTAVHYTSQKYKKYCREQPKGSVACRFRGYRPFSKEEVLAFMGLSFISGAHIVIKNPTFDLYDSKFLPHFKAALSRDRLLLLIKFCRFDNVNTRDDQKDDRFGHIREVWDTFNTVVESFMV